MVAHEPAFPLYVPKTTGAGGHPETIYPGMSMRAHAAMEFLAAAIGSIPVIDRPPIVREAWVRAAYEWADELIKQDEG